MTFLLIIRIACCSCIALSPLAAQQTQIIPQDLQAAILKLPRHQSRAEGVLIQVVDSEGKPLGGASILTLSRSRAAALSRETQRVISEVSVDRRMQTLALLYICADRYLADGDGKVVIPTTAERAQVFALHKQRLARSIIKPDIQVVQLRFLDPSPIHVLVVDSSGNPAPGIIVSFLAAGRIAQTPGASCTDKSGRAQLQRQSLELMTPGSLQNKVFAHILGDDLIAVEADPFVLINSAESPLRLKLPEYSRVDVSVFDQKGLAHEQIDRTTLSLKHDSNDPTVSANRRIRSATVNGKVSFFVQTGLDLTATFSIYGQDCSEQKHFAGPATSGKEQQIRVEGVKRANSIRFRLIGVDGKAVTSEHIGAVFISERGSSIHEITTSATGEMFIQVPSMFQGNVEVEFRIQRVRLPKTRGRGGLPIAVSSYLGAYRATLAKTLARPSGSDLQLKQPSLVLSGQVVDELGQPVAGIVLELARNTGNRSSRRTFGSDYFQSRLITGQDGRFEFREEADLRDHLELSFTSKTHKPRDSITFEPGSENVVITALQTFAIHGRILGTPHNMHSGLGVVALAEGVARDATAIQYAHTAAGGGFTIHNCLPGVYRVEVRDRQSRIMRVIEKVNVTKGADSRDHRLMAIDPSDYTRWIKIEVVDDQSRPIPDCLVKVVDKRGGASGQSTDRHGRIQVMLMLNRDSISVERLGFRPQSFEGLRGDLRVVLRKSLRLRVRIANMPTLKTAALVVDLKESTKRRQGFDRNPRQVIKSTADECAFDLASTGKPELTLTVYCRRPPESLRAQMAMRSDDNEQFRLTTVWPKLGLEAEGEAPVVIKLSSAQVEFLKQYDKLLQERRLKK